MIGVVSFSYVREGGRHKIPRSPENALTIKALNKLSFKRSYGFHNWYQSLMALDLGSTRSMIDYICFAAKSLKSADLEQNPNLGFYTISCKAASDLDLRLDKLLIDGMMYALQEQTNDDANVMLNGFGVIVNSRWQRVKPYLPQICGTIAWHLNNKMGLFGRITTGEPGVKQIASKISVAPCLLMLLGFSQRKLILPVFVDINAASVTRLI
ncbi:splicing factor 3B subunit 1 [Tanacetum coccineum]|uniref:Splicing factor 3B subunit 1 n=1 Tax=Tanacetum coccineum TaxID=301880 RepID=A0ABQ5E1R9_9ASTR